MLSSFLFFFYFSIFYNTLVTQFQLMHSFPVRITQDTDFQQEHLDIDRQGNQYVLNHISQRCHYTAANAK